MGLRIDKQRAYTQLERALDVARSDAELPAVWIERTQRVARFEDKTCLVLLGTALLATATDDTVDALTLKARAGNRAYSARGLAHGVLTPASIDHGFDLRTTGREPFKNKPFLNSDRVDAMPPVGDPEEIRYLIECLEAVRYLREEEAMEAFSAFLRQRIAARKEKKVPVHIGQASADLMRLKDACSHFLEKRAESDKRAQALIAAAFDLVFDDVRTASVLDPSRKRPGDVQALYKLEPVVAVLVSAKPVTYSDAVHFVSAVSAAGFPHAMIAGLEAVDAEVLRLSREPWAETGVYVTVYTQYSDILLDALAWSRRPLPQLLAVFPRHVVARLTQLEVEASSMALWGQLVS